MKKSSVCIVLIFLLAACGSATTDVSPTATIVLPLPTAIPPTVMPTHIPPAEVQPTATSVPTMATAIPATPTRTPVRPSPTPVEADEVELLTTLSGHNDRVIDLAFSGDGTYIASSSLDRTIRLWDVTSRQEVDAFSMNKVGFNGIAFSPDGRLLASADAIWDVESRQVVHTLEQGRQVPGPVAFSPDGSLLAVALESQPIKLWDVASGQVLRTFAEQADDVTFRIVFSPDGTLLAAGVHGGMVRLWDVASGQSLALLSMAVKSMMYTTWHFHPTVSSWHRVAPTRRYDCGTSPADRWCIP